LLSLSEVGAFINCVREFQIFIIKIGSLKNMTRNIHVIGTGTIGGPLINLLARYSREMNLDNVTFHKRTPFYHDRSRIVQLIESGAKLAVDEKKTKDFQELGIEAKLTSQEALDQADVVIDCTPAGNQNKIIYETLEHPKGFLAQGSESGFGKRYARGINDESLNHGEDRFIQVVSCNTHAISATLNTLAYQNGRNLDNLISGNFICIRRANDISQDNGFIASPNVEKHKNDHFGTHHAHDAYELFQTVGISPNITSSAVKVNSQYMHLIQFNLQVKEKTSVENLINLIEENDRLALTYKKSANQVFSFGRDHGFYGRILNQAVFPRDSIQVREKNGSYEIAGSCLTPQDGNSLLSSVSASLWLLNPETYNKDLQCLKSYFFEEV